MDDVSIWAPTFELAPKYLRCQLQVCLAQNLSLSLKKSLFFPARIEFVGHDVYDNGNRPSQSKNNSLRTWLRFVTSGLISSNPLGEVSHLGKTRSKQLYNVHRQQDSHDITPGTGVYLLDGICPPYGPQNYNNFGSAFGIKTDFSNKEFIEQFLRYEMVSCFMMSNNMSFTVAHHQKFPGMVVMSQQEHPTGFVKQSSNNYCPFVTKVLESWIHSQLLPSPQQL